MYDTQRVNEDIIADLGEISLKNKAREFARNHQSVYSVKDYGGEELRWKRLSAVYGLQGAQPLPRGTPDLNQPVY